MNDATNTAVTVISLILFAFGPVLVHRAAVRLRGRAPRRVRHDSDDLTGDHWLGSPSPTRRWTGLDQQHGGVGFAGGDAGAGGGGDGGGC